MNREVHIKLIWFSIHAVLMMVPWIPSVYACVCVSVWSVCGVCICCAFYLVDIGHARALAIEMAHAHKEEGGD